MLSTLLALCEDNLTQRSGMIFHKTSYGHLDVFFVVNLTQLLDKESSCYCLERSWSDMILIINCTIGCYVGHHSAQNWSPVFVMLHKLELLGFPLPFLLTHWGRVTHICISKLTVIGSDNGLSPGRRQAIIWTNDGILLIGPLGTNFNEILIGIQTFSFKVMHFKMLSAKWCPFCLGLNMLSLPQGHKMRPLREPGCHSCLIILCGFPPSPGKDLILLDLCLMWSTHLSKLNHSPAIWSINSITMF